MEFLQVSPPLRAQLLAEEEVVHGVRHVHRLGVERVRRRCRRHPQVPRDLFHQDKSSDGTPRAIDLLDGVTHRRLDGNRGLRCFHCQLLRQHRVRKLSDRLHRSVSVVTGMVVVAAVVDDVAALGEDPYRRIALDVVVPAHNLMHRAVHLGNNHAVGQMRRVLLVHLDGGGFPHGFKATRPRAPRRVEVNEEYGGAFLDIFEVRCIQRNCRIRVLPLRAGLDRRGVFLDHRRGRCVRLVVSMRRLPRAPPIP
mmetsp:Transcript_33654/g.84703  ORF Transcript_33654/g.84703 Transcript_33654/m.84703 type:complete len:252 (-) Transcript_33654:420-1175(-)